MATSVDEIVEFHERQAARARLVAQRYPEATHEKHLGFAAFVDGSAEHNRVEVLVDGDGHAVIVPYELVAEGDVAGCVRRRMYWDKSVRSALEFLRERHPEAYAALVKWASE